MFLTKFSSSEKNTVVVFYFVWFGKAVGRASKTGKPEAEGSNLASPIHF